MDIVFASEHKDVVPCIKLRFGSADTKALEIALRAIMDRTRKTRTLPKIRFGRRLVGPKEAMECYHRAKRDAGTSDDDGGWTLTNNVLVYFPSELRWLLEIVLETLEVHLARVRQDIARAWDPPKATQTKN